MFRFDEVIDKLDRFNKMPGKKQRKFLYNLVMDNDFIEWLFQPPKDANLTEKVEVFYGAFTKPSVLKALDEMILDYGYSEFDRSQATFFYSVINIALSSNNERVDEVKLLRKAGEISNQEARRTMDKIDDVSRIITDLFKTVKKIVKRDAKSLSRETRLPRYICTSALHTVPDPGYVDRFKIGYYLNTLLSTIYSDISINGEFDREPRWREFFKEIFGKDNVVEVATFILLEGVHRIDKYNNSRDVRICWDSLTTFALKELNGSPEALRNQMIELYMKRLSKMFNNKAFDLRVDLTRLDEDLFPKLVTSIEKYSDKLVNILNSK